MGASGNNIKSILNYIKQNIITIILNIIFLCGIIVYYVMFTNLPGYLYSIEQDYIDVNAKIWFSILLFRFILYILPATLTWLLTRKRKIYKNMPELFKFISIFLIQYMTYMFLSFIYLISSLDQVFANQIFGWGSSIQGTVLFIICLIIYLYFNNHRIKKKEY